MMIFIIELWQLEKALTPISTRPSHKFTQHHLDQLLAIAKFISWD
jgi:hypothetical protein